MSKLHFTTRSARKEDIVREWYLVDATNQTLGRLSSQIATILRGKHKSSYTPHVDAGDFVIVVNCEKIVLTGNKLDDKTYIHYTGYPGGQKKEIAKSLLARRPIAIIEKAVKGMLPKNKLGNQMYKKLFVYEGGEHPHSAQKPEILNLKY